MSNRRRWTRQELLVAFRLYCQIPFGKLHSLNPEIIKIAELIDRTPSALAMKLANIASLDPAITSTGRKGLSSASNADKEMWQEMQNNWENFAIESENTINSILRGSESYVAENESASEYQDYTGQDRIVPTKTRIGQNFFRKSVLSAYKYRCCITGLAIPKLLVASHIVPWRDDPANRLNPRNGLALSILHDKAFDLGMITINDDMTVRVSRKDFRVRNKFFVTALRNYDGKSIELPDKFQPYEDFLAYHRKNIFMGNR